MKIIFSLWCSPKAADGLQVTPGAICDLYRRNCGQGGLEIDNQRTARLYDCGGKRLADALPQLQNCEFVFPLRGSTFTETADSTGVAAEAIGEHVEKHDRGDA